MSLNRNDIQILREVFQPQFDKIYKRFDQIDKRFEELEDRMNKRFEEVENNLVKQFIAEIYHLYTTREDFNKLEKRVTDVEVKLQQ